jgi:hypothetical protein
MEIPIVGIWIEPWLIVRYGVVKLIFRSKANEKNNFLFSSQHIKDLKNVKRCFNIDARAKGPMEEKNR